MKQKLPAASRSVRWAASLLLVASACGDGGGDGMQKTASDFSAVEMALAKKRIGDQLTESAATLADAAATRVFLPTAEQEQIEELGISLRGMRDDLPAVCAVWAETSKAVHESLFVETFLARISPVDSTPLRLRRRRIAAYYTYLGDDSRRAALPQDPDQWDELEALAKTLFRRTGATAFTQECARFAKPGDRSAEELRRLLRELAQGAGGALVTHLLNVRVRSESGFGGFESSKNVAETFAPELWKRMRKQNVQRDFCRHAHGGERGAAFELAFMGDAFQRGAIDADDERTPAEAWFEQIEDEDWDPASQMELRRMGKMSVSQLVAKLTAAAPESSESQVPTASDVPSNEAPDYRAWSRAEIVADLAGYAWQFALLPELVARCSRCVAEDAGAMP